jgi:cation diffusion facilitator family transporter
MNQKAKVVSADLREIKAAQISILGAVIIFLISLTIGIAIDSVALLLDAGTGFVILLMTFWVRSIIRKIHSPPDHRYNFGYEKYEPLTMALQNSAIIFTCVIGLAFAIQDIVHPDHVASYGLATVATFLCTLLAISLALYLLKVSKETGSQLLKTSARQWLIDSSLSIGMFAGFFLGFLLLRSGHSNIAVYLDPGLAIALAFVVMRFPLRALAGNIRELLDSVPTQRIHERITNVVEKHKSSFSGLHRMRVRKAGKKTFLDIGFNVRGSMTVDQAQSLAEDFERELAREVPGCDTIVYFKKA